MNFECTTGAELKFQGGINCYKGNVLADKNHSTSKAIESDLLCHLRNLEKFQLNTVQLWLNNLIDLLELFQFALWLQGGFQQVN